MKKIGILCSGGDAPGMNSCVAGLTRLGLLNGFNMVGIMRGFEGLLNEDFIKLDRDYIKNIENFGGSVLKTSRCMEMYTEQGIQKAVKNIKKNNFDCIVVLGGNGSLIAVLKMKNLGANLIFIPSTIDNDLRYTSKSLGFDTAVNNAVDAIEKIKDTMYSNDRGAVVEVMGRESGDIALHSAIATNANFLIIKEVPYDIEKIIEGIKNCQKVGVENPLIVVAENILNIDELAKDFEFSTNKEFRAGRLGYIQRGGTPTIYDKVLGYQWANETIDLIDKEQYNKAIGIYTNNVISLDLDQIDNNQICFNRELYSTYEKLNKIK